MHSLSMSHVTICILAEASVYSVNHRILMCMRQVAHSCRGKGAASCDVLPVDLSQSGDVEKFAKDVLAKHKQVDVLVNNAGMGAPGQNSPLSDPGIVPCGAS